MEQHLFLPPPWWNTCRNDKRVSIFRCFSWHGSLLVFVQPLPAYCRSWCLGKNHLRRYLAKAGAKVSAIWFWKDVWYCLLLTSTHWGHSRYCSILASWIQAFPFFPTPLNSPSVLLRIRRKQLYAFLYLLTFWLMFTKGLMGSTYLTCSPCSSNTTISSTPNTTQARAICPAR